MSHLTIKYCIWFCLFKNLCKPFYLHQKPQSHHKKILSLFYNIFRITGCNYKIISYFLFTHFPFYCFGSSCYVIPPSLLSPFYPRHSLTVRGKACLSTSRQHKRQAGVKGAAWVVASNAKLCAAVSNYQRGVTVQFPATSPYNERTITVNPGGGGATESGKVSNICSFVSSVSLSRVHSNMAACNYWRPALPTSRRSASIVPRRGCNSARGRGGDAPAECGEDQFSKGEWWEMLGNLCV